MLLFLFPLDGWMWFHIKSSMSLTLYSEFFMAVGVNIIIYLSAAYCLCCCFPISSHHPCWLTACLWSGTSHQGSKLISDNWNNMLKLLKYHPCAYLHYCMLLLAVAAAFSNHWCPYVHLCPLLTDHKSDENYEIFMLKCFSQLLLSGYSRKKGKHHGNSVC